MEPWIGDSWPQLAAGRRRDRRVESIEQRVGPNGSSVVRGRKRVKAKDARVEATVRGRRKAPAPA